MANAVEIEVMVREYMNPQEPPHAMLLYGEWGSGKSFFVRNVLKKYLEDLDDPVVMIYTTAAGFTTSDELMKRLVTSYVNEKAGIDQKPDDDKKEKLRKAFKGLGLTFLQNEARKITKETGISFSINDDLLLSLALSRNVLVVIDDLERRTFSLNQRVDDGECSSGFDNELFSVLSRLVDEQGHKVLLVSNSASAIPDDIAEKLVWKRVGYDPDPAELVEQILANSVSKFPNDLEARDQVISAQELTGHCNARRLIRIKPLILLMSQCEFFGSNKIDLAIRKDTFKDVLFIALTFMDSKNLKEPDDSDLIAQYDFEQLRSKYNTLRFLKVFFDEGRISDIDEVNDSLEKFAKKYHPQSHKEQKAIAAVNSVFGYAFEDEDGREHIDSIVDALDSGEMDVSKIPVIIRAASFLCDVGIASRNEYDHIIQASERLLLENPSYSRSAINEEPINWQEINVNDVVTIDAIDLLRETALKQFEDEAYERLMEGAGEPSEITGMQIAHNADAWFGSDPVGLIAISPEELGEHLKVANSASILELHKAISRMNEEGILRAREQGEKVKEWNQELLASLIKINTDSLMHNHRIKLLRAYLESL